MPKMPPVECSEPMCYSMATKKGKCDKHQPEPWKSSKGKTSTERGYGYKWRKTRDRIMRRDSYLCQACLRRGIITEAKEVDHILNKARGGTDADSNLEAICVPCHRKKTLRERNE